MNYLKVIKAIRAQEQAEKKQQEVDKLSEKPLNYGIIRDLVNSATYGVKITVMLADGTRLVIEPDGTPPPSPESPLF